MSVISSGMPTPETLVAQGYTTPKRRASAEDALGMLYSLYGKPFGIYAAAITYSWFWLVAVDGEYLDLPYIVLKEHASIGRVRMAATFDTWPDRGGEFATDDYVYRCDPEALRASLRAQGRVA